MKQRQAHLDVLRGLAAFFVCISHLRSFLFTDSSNIRSPGIFSTLVYFATSLGHQCVVVFFVMSGFFVGGGVVRSFSRKSWSWKQYASRRLTRLWIVLLPALFLTLAFDLAGHYLAPAGYATLFHDLSWPTFVGNVFFLQTIVTPFFGTNYPLWSLANEFWYYALFPLMFGIVRSPKGAGRFLCLLLFGLLVAWLPQRIFLGGLIWMFGVGSFWAAQNPGCRKMCGSQAFLIGSGLAAFGSLAFIKIAAHFGLYQVAGITIAYQNWNSGSFGFWGSDYLVGISFALFILALSFQPCEWPNYSKVAALMAETAYTLYLAHYPFMAFVVAMLFKGRKLQPDLAGCLWFGGLLVITVIFTTSVWWCFERNTDVVRKWVEKRIASRMAPRNEVVNSR